MSVQIASEVQVYNNFLSKTDFDYFQMDIRCGIVDENK